MTRETESLVRNCSPEPQRSGLIRFLLGAAVIGVALMLVASTSGLLRQQPPVGYVLSTLSLMPLNAQARPLSADDLRGKVTLINFWATWCGPCVEEMPQLLRMADGYRDRAEFQFLSVSTGHPDLPTLHSETEVFLQQRGYQLPVYADPQDRTRAAIQGVEPGLVPVTVLVDREGKVANVCVGFDPAVLDEINLQIAALLKDAKR